MMPTLRRVSLIAVVTTAVLPPTVRPDPKVPFPLRVIEVVDGLESPTALRFAGDGSLFVTEKAGQVLAFESIFDPSPTVLIDLSIQVNSHHDRGLLGLAIHPDYPTPRHLYVLYTYDAPPGMTAPVWNDQCPNPPSANIDGCVVSGRLSKIEIAGDGTATETVLIGDEWCQQFPSHSIGGLAFGHDGALYVSAGDGAKFLEVDYGQHGGSQVSTPTQTNPCGDPGDGILPVAEGGALRSQDLLTLADPVGYSGTILRLESDGGTPHPTNPLVGGDPRDDAIIAYGLRNPFRFTIDPQSSALYVGDVGWNHWEEVNRVEPLALPVKNFGWPCFEGPHRQPLYEALGLSLCEDLYNTPTSHAGPFFTYPHSMPPHGPACNAASPNALTGLGFLGPSYPSRWAGSLVLADSFVGCLWALPLDQNGDPSPTGPTLLVSDAGWPVDLTRGPDGRLYWVDLVAGTIQLLGYDPAGLFGDGFESGNTQAWQ